MELHNLVHKFFTDRGHDLDQPGTHIYLPEDWRARGEAYGNTADLVLVHDGGPMAPYCNWDYEDVASTEEFREFLEAQGYFCESCTSWYSAVYPLNY